MIVLLAILLAILLGGGTWSGTAWAWGCIQALALLAVVSADAWAAGRHQLVATWWALAGATLAAFFAGIP